MNFENKISELNIELPEAKAPVGAYVATKISGHLLYVSGQISINSNGELIKGKVGKDLTTDEAYKAAERCGLSIVSQVKKACDGDLSKVKSCIKLTGFVNSTEDFTEQPKVINGASDLIASIFGEAGMHTRAAVSTNSLPLGVSVEVDAIFELNQFYLPIPKYLNPCDLILSGENIFLISKILRFCDEDNFLKLIDLKSFHSVCKITKCDPFTAS